MNNENNLIALGIGLYLFIFKINIIMKIKLTQQVTTTIIHRVILLYLFFFFFYGTHRQTGILSYQNIIFDGTILILCSINITCNCTFITFGSSLIFF